MADAAVLPRRPEQIPVVQPPVLQENPGDRPKDVRTWLARVDIYFTSVNLNRRDEDQLGDRHKISMLVPLLGTEGFQRLLNNPIYSQWTQNPADITYAQFRQALISEFGQTVTVEKCRFDYFRRYQEQGESVQEYIGALRTLAADCNFKGIIQEGNRDIPFSYLDSMLKTQLIIGAADPAAQKELMGTEHDPPLTFAATERFFIAREAAQNEARAMGNKRGQAPGTVGILRRGGASTRGRRGGAGGEGTGTCRNCGFPRHGQLEPCPAAAVKCTACGREGHFMRMCRSSGTTRGRGRGQQRGRGRARGFGRPDQVGEAELGISQVALTGQAIDAISKPPKILYRFTIFGTGHNSSPPQTHLFELDTGAEATIVSPSTHSTVFGGTQLSQEGPGLKFLNGSRCGGWKGTFRTKLGLGGRHASGRIHVVKGVTTDVVGRDFLYPLGVSIQCQADSTATVGTVKLDREQVSRQFPALIQKGTGTFKGEPHRIQMDKRTVPFACRLRPIPLARREAACAEIRKMDEEGIWEPVGASEWAHPLVTVGKKDGGVRVTTDLTRLNIGVIPDRHPLPRIGEIFHNLASSKVFSKLDITKGYWHIPLHPDSQHLTTTITPLGLRRYLRLPMGLKDAASAFQKRIQQTLLGVQGVEVYIDDVIIHGKDQKEHDEALQATLTALQGAGFRLNMDKCAFGKGQVKAFGHLVGATGIKPDPGNIAAIKQIPVPLNAADVISFLGAVNFFGDSIPDMASLSEPLRRLTRGGEPFQWGPDQATAFSTLKAEVERATLRQGFDPARKTYVTTDASDVGIGGVLSQADEQGEEVVIAFYSKTLDKAQRNYAANEREALACMLAIEHWEPLLLGRHFTLRTDHQALETMLKNPKTRRESSKFPRWLQRLQEFDYDIQYLPGLENKLPDYLSRLRERADSLQVKAITQGALRDAYKEDPFAEELVVTVRQGTWGPWKKGNPLSRIFYGLRQQLHTSPEGFVMKGRRIWVPGTALRRQILREAHEGHTGIVGTKATIRRTYWWTGMGREVEEWVGRCQGCQRSSKSKPVGDKRQASSIPRPITPGAQYGVDLMGPCADGNHYLVLIDYATGYPFVWRRKTFAAQDIIRFLKEKWDQFGFPEGLVSDNGPQFIAKTSGTSYKNTTFTTTGQQSTIPQRTGSWKDGTGISRTGCRRFLQ